jgi:Bardet-Biedl syndrome 7 protein
MSNDKINHLAVAPVILPDEENPILACQDRFVRVVQGSDLYYEASVNGAATVILRCEANDDARAAAGAQETHAGRKEVLWGTEQGSVGQLFLDGEAVQRGWVLDGKRGRGGGVSAVYAEADITGDGVNDVVVGRDNGAFEVYSLDRNGEPVRVYERDLNEAVQCISHGSVSTASPELLVHTFSGKVLAFRPGADTQTIDGFALGVPQSQGQVKAASDEVRQRVAGIKQQLTQLSKEVDRARKAYVEFSGDLIAVDGPTKILDKFQLDSESACYKLSLEAPSAMFAVSIHSNVPLDLLDVKDNAAICSRSMPDPANGTFALATYRMQESTNRVDIKMRAIEGQAGQVRAYVVPRQSPKTCVERVYEIKPLCLHRRATRVDTAGRPMSELRIQGQFTLDDMHTWVGACLNEVPARAPVGQTELTYEFENVLLTTVLQVTVRDGEGRFRSDSITPLALLKEYIAREATNLKMRINISYDLADATVAHFCKIVHPKLLYQLNLTGQSALIEGLKEIRMQEDDLSFLSDEYRAILEEETRIVAEIKEQPRQLDYIHGIIKDFFVDWHKFKGSNVKHMLSAIDQVLDQYSLERLVAVIERGGP